jgi:hypothetical protein
MKVLRAYVLSPVAICVDLKGRPLRARRRVGGLGLAAGRSRSSERVKYPAA